MSSKDVLIPVPFPLAKKVLDYVDSINIIESDKIDPDRVVEGAGYFDPWGNWKPNECDVRVWKNSKNKPEETRHNITVTMTPLNVHANGFNKVKRVRHEFTVVDHELVLILTEVGPTDKSEDTHAITKARGSENRYVQVKVDEDVLAEITKKERWQYGLKCVAQGYNHKPFFEVRTVAGDLQWTIPLADLLTKQRKALTKKVKKKVRK